MIKKPLRTTDIILGLIFFINSILIFIKYGNDLIGQVIFNIVVGILMFIMSFTSTRPGDIPLQDRTVYYFTRIALALLILFTGFVLISEMLDGIRKILI